MACHVCVWRFRLCFPLYFRLCDGYVYSFGSIYYLCRIGEHSMESGTVLIGFGWMHKDLVKHVGTHGRSAREHGG